MINKRGIMIYQPIGMDNISENILIEAPCAVKNGYCCVNKPLQIGAFTYSNSLAIENVKIGRYCSIGPFVFMGGVHPLDFLSTSPFQYDSDFFFFSKYLKEKPNDIFKLKESKTIEIGNDVFIGAFTFLKSGVKIGDGAVIGAHSVVVSDIPPYAVAVGNPARIVKYRFSQEIIDKLLKLKWWEYKYTDFKNVDFSNITKAIEQIECLKRNNKIKKYIPQDILTDKNFSDFIEKNSKNVNFLQIIFSITNEEKHKVLRLLGLKIKLKMDKKK